VRGVVVSLARLADRSDRSVSWKLDSGQ
jgi:hypothetical protein